MADAIATNYVDLNGSPGVDVDPDLPWSYSGRAGRITVTSEANEPAVFAPFLGIASDQEVAATATARSRHVRAPYPKSHTGAPSSGHAARSAAG